ncbi:MAG: hypothetical protein WCT85_01450 [Parachlamydiales bacterium]|jgi:hypothetical protein
MNKILLKIVYQDRDLQKRLKIEKYINEILLKNEYGMCDGGFLGLTKEMQSIFYINENNLTEAFVLIRQFLENDQEFKNYEIIIKNFTNGN